MRLFGTVTGAVDRTDRAEWMSPPFDLAFLVFINPAIPTDIQGTIAPAPGYPDATSLIVRASGWPSGGTIAPALGYPDRTSTIKRT